MPWLLYFLSFKLIFDVIKVLLKPIAKKDNLSQEENEIQTNYIGQEREKERL